MNSYRSANRPGIAALLLASLLIAVPGESQQSDVPAGPDGTLSREALVALVLERNPSLEAARAAARGATERAVVESSLDDPRVMTRVAPLSISSDMDFGAMVEVEQMLPWAGRRGARAKLGRAEAEMRALDLEEMRAELAAEAGELWAELWLAERQIETNGHHGELLADLRGAAEAQYVVGAASQQDLIQAEVELARTKESAIRLEASRLDAIARINALLHRVPGAPLPPLPSTIASGAMALPPGDALAEEAVATRPALAAADASIRGAQASAELASLARKPDWALSALYDSMQESDHQVQVGVSVNLPLWRGRLAAAEREAAANVEEAESRKAAIEDRVRLDVDLARRAVSTAKSLATLYRDRLVPAATDQLAAARAGFEAGRNPFLALLIAENNLRDVTLGGHEAAAELVRSLAMLDRALGRVPAPVEGN